MDEEELDLDYFVDKVDLWYLEAQPLMRLTYENGESRLERVKFTIRLSSSVVEYIHPDDPDEVIEDDLGEYSELLLTPEEIMHFLAVMMAEYEEVKADYIDWVPGHHQDPDIPDLSWTLKPTAVKGYDTKVHLHVSDPKKDNEWEYYRMRLPWLDETSYEIGRVSKKADMSEVIEHSIQQLNLPVLDELV